MIRRAVITGASSGIGAATAEMLADEGYAVWLTYANDEAGANLTAEKCAVNSPDVEVSRLDLRNPSSIDELTAEIMESWGHLHVVVNNGGICPYTAFEDIDLDEWDNVLETNARGAFLFTRSALPLLRAASPDDRSVINLSSVAGQAGALKTGIHYAASKGALLAITRSFARLLAGERIRVNAVCPGPVVSPLTDHLVGEPREALTAAIPLGRFGTAAETAWIISGLASEKASFVTGASYDVNGGVRID